MSITSNNKTSFKNWLKEYQEIFGPGHLVKDYMGLVNEFLTSSESGVTSKLDQPVNIVLWDFDETIDLTGSLREGEYYYFPAIPEDKVKIKNGSSTYTMNFDADGKWQGKSLGSIQTIGDKKIKLVGIGGTLVQTQVSPTYAISEDKTSANEGETVTFTVTTTNVANNTNISWTTLGTTDSNDFTNSTSGQVNIQNNTGTITRTLSNDLSVGEGAENFQIRLYSGSTTLALSSSIAVADTSSASYNLSGATTVVEGNTVTYTITTTGVPDGTNLYFSANLTSYDITPTSGNITINSNTATFTITTKQDYRIEGNETLTVSLRTNGTNGPVVATASTTLSDKPFTVTLTPAATTINESTSATSNIVINVTTTDVEDGETFRAYPVASGGSTITFGTTGDFDNSYYEFTVQNNAATITIPVNRDGRTEGSEDVIIQVKDAANSTVIAATPAITINDTSYIGKDFIDKTFGPINVNRDNGVSSNASDWYTICGLDKLPDGAKIAIFVDISGSMTMQTVQASYDLLISKLQARNMDVITVQNQNEDWITPFDQILT